MDLTMFNLKQGKQLRLMEDQANSRRMDQANSRRMDQANSRRMGVNPLNQWRSDKVSSKKIFFST